MTNRRVLSDEEIRKIDGYATWYAGSGASDALLDEEYRKELDLIATIRDRDKTILELRTEIVAMKTALYGADSKFTESARQLLAGEQTT